MIPLYYGTIQDGKLHLTRNEKGLFRAYLDTLEGKEVQVAVEERKDQRTLNQNAYLWVWSISLFVTTRATSLRASTSGLRTNS
jgi:hypothetical protein